jgi:hypothetical protein
MTAIQTIAEYGLLRLFNGSVMVPNDSELVPSDDTAVLIGISPIEARIYLENRNLKLPDRVRRAALEPLQPLFESMSGERSLDVME